MSTLPVSLFREITHSSLSSANRMKNGKSELRQVAAINNNYMPQILLHAPISSHNNSPVTYRRNDPYNWAWRVNPAVSTPVVEVPEEPDFDVSDTQNALCSVLVQFKCHHAEFRSNMELRKGQYVAVEGDRGIDIGIVMRINTDEAKQYVERTGPTGAVLRFATQREVDYWATDLKNDEAAALEYARQRVLKHRLTMDVRHAEYQFDKKKLTFYYEAKSRVDFVTLNKELFREFSCRIWMEKVRIHE